MVAGATVIVDIHVHILLLQVKYLIDEAFNVGKGANSIVSMLHHFLHHHGSASTFMLTISVAKTRTVL